MGDIFISYREADSKPWAISLRDDLADLFGDDRVFLDKDALHAGNWRQQIVAALDRCKVVIVVIGSKWLTVEDEHKRRRLTLPDDVHRQEIALALSRSDVTVIPLRVDGAAMPRAEDLPDDLKPLADQQSREIGDTKARRQVDLEILTKDIETITGLQAIRAQHRTSASPATIDFPMPDGRPKVGWLATLVVVFVLSVMLWVTYYYLAGGTAPREETPVLVLLALGLTMFGKWLWRNLQRRKHHHRADVGAAARHVLVLLFVLHPGGFVVGSASVQDIDLGAADAPFLPLCVAEKLTVEPGGSVPLRVWVTTPQGERPDSHLEYTWEVDAGSVRSQGSQAQWDVGDVEDTSDDGRLLIAKVIVRDREGRSRECRVGVFVVQRTTEPPGDPGDHGGVRGVRTTGKVFLARNEREESGYGLYSYLLFGSKPNADERASYLTAIEAYLRVLPSVSELAQHLAPSELNVTYIPVTEKPSSGETDRDWAEQILEVYDYARAKVLLVRLGDEYPSGPYIVSVRSPLSENKASAYLFEDLRRIVPSLMQAWIEAFVWFAAKERSWTERNVRYLGLNIRNVVKVSGLAASEMVGGVDSRLQFVEKAR